MISESAEDYELVKEARAWKWLLDLERMPWCKRGFRQMTQQVIVRAHPGKLGRRANYGLPYVTVSVEVPGVEGRTLGMGNCLAKAVHDVYLELRKKDAELPELHRSVSIY